MNKYRIGPKQRIPPGYQRDSHCSGQTEIDLDGYSRAAQPGMLGVLRYQQTRRSSSWVREADAEGNLPVHHAARHNHAHVLQALADSGAELDARAADSATALHLASRHNSPDAARFLLTHGASVNARDQRRRTPLHYSTRRGHNIVTKLLLSVSSCEINARDRDLSTPLHMAAVYGDPAIVELLISRSADVSLSDINKTTALMWAAAEGHVTVAQLLLTTAEKHGVTDYVSARDSEGSSALHLAVQNGHVQLCELLLEWRADANCRKLNQCSPLHLAAGTGALDIARVLLLYGAQVDSQDADLMTPAHRAAMYNKVELLKILHAHGAKLDALNRQHRTPLHIAAWKGQTAAVDFLLRHRAKLTVVDESFRTVLHCAVEYGHFNTLQTLLMHGGRKLLEASDKNHQTILHYAASKGSLLILKVLLEANANPGSKDQEERTPLHLAAISNAVSCVDALIARSAHELNDDDHQGCTPVMLACTHGHLRVVQLLLSLGADLSHRDDDHRSALMLAAENGHVEVMRSVLDNQAALNETDKAKNTALHYSCHRGHIGATLLLLDRHADVTMKNINDKTPLDNAIDNMQVDVAIAMLKHHLWDKAIAVHSKDNVPIVDRLIAKMPEAAMIVLDHCIDKSRRDDDDINLTVTYRYHLIDPGPDDSSSSRQRYWALNTMVSHNREQLLVHPVCQTLLARKWSRFGRPIFYINLLVYFSYLSIFTFFLLYYSDYQEHCCPTGRLFVREVLPTRQYNGTEPPLPSLCTRKSPLRLFAGLVCILTIIFFLRELFKSLTQRLRYFSSFFNWLALMLIASTWFFMAHALRDTCNSRTFRSAWISLFLSWLNFIMYLRRIDSIGIYVIMLVTVCISLLKAILVFFFFCFAFALAFHMLMSHMSSFRSPWLSALATIVMTLGEVDFENAFAQIDQTQAREWSTDIYVLLTIFLFLMPIVLMNLMIGIAVGDIDKIQQNAYMKRISLQVELLYHFEKSMPRWLQRKVHKPSSTVQPNAKQHWNMNYSPRRAGSSVHDLKAAKLCATLHDLVANLERTLQNHQSMNGLSERRNAQPPDGASSTASEKSAYDNEPPFNSTSCLSLLSQSLGSLDEKQNLT